MVHGKLNQTPLEGPTLAGVRVLAILACAVLRQPVVPDGSECR
jgi:hypothetical protein